MYGKGKLILGIILGIIGAVAVFCIAVAIGCAVNGLSFGEQIVSWAGHVCPIIEETAEEVVDTGTEVAEIVSAL